MSLTLNVEILGEYRKLTNATKGASKQLSGLNKTAGKISGSINGALAAIGIGFSLSAVINGFKESTKAAIEDQKSKELLSKALEDNLKLTDAQVDSIEKFIGKTQLATSVADDKLRPAFSKLAIGTKDTTKAQELLSIALDVSAGTGKNLDTVAQAMARALEGNDTALARLVPSVKNAKDPMQALADTFDGAAEAAAKTDPYAQMEIIFGELQEQIGMALLPVLQDFSEWLRTPEGQEKMQDIVDGIVAIITEAGKLIDWIMEVKDSFGKLDSSVGVVGTSLFFLLNNRLLLFAASNPTMALALAGIALIATGMYTVYENTRKATTAMEEFQRIQGIEQALKNPVVTPEELSSATYKGILGDNPALNPPKTTGSTGLGIAGQKVVPKASTSLKSSPSPSSPVVINNNVTVKKSIASGPDIAKAINTANRNLGTQTIKNLKY